MKDTKKETKEIADELVAEIRDIPAADIDENCGQIEGVPKNPRKITMDRFRALCDSIRKSPEMKELSEVVVYPHEGRYVAISGNHRLRAYKKLNWETVRCKVLRVNAYHYVCKQSEQAGGCAAIRNRQREEEQLMALRRKWGGG